MSLEIARTDFDQRDIDAFGAKLRSGVRALAQLLRRPGFGCGKVTIGSEVEFALVGPNGRPWPINRTILREAFDPRLALEIDRFNLEYNSAARPLAGRAFSPMGDEVRDALTKIDRVAARHGGRLALVGILPTLQEDDLQSSAMSESARFRALSRSLRRLRSSSPFHIEITGDETLELDCDDVTMEGANTSFQLHLRVAPEDFAATFNAAQLAAAPVLAISANSPIFLSRLLWRETRIALFGRAVDYRIEGAEWRPARVSFGHGWVRRGALECFEESVALHRPLLPVVGGEDPEEVVRSGGVPQLDELRLHHGTVWSWNRAVYDSADGGHLRIELRALPTGPTVADMMANAAFFIGLTLGLREHVDAMIPRIPFRLVHDNFYRSARDGLDSMLVWPTPESPSPEAHRASDLATRLLPVARQGLELAGVDAAEVDLQLGVIARRLEVGRTGAQWQRDALKRLERSSVRPVALVDLLAAYLDRMDRGRPVAEWEMP